MPSDYLVVYRCIFIMLMQIHGQVQLCVVSIYCSNYVIGAGGGSRGLRKATAQDLLHKKEGAGLIPRAAQV